MKASKAIQECVNRRMKQMDCKDKPLKQRLAIAYSYCRKVGRAKRDLAEEVFEKLKNDLFVEDQEGPIPSWKLRDVLNIEAPYQVATPSGKKITGLRALTDRPMIPVSSSNVKGVGVFKSDLLVQFHDTPGTYRYHFDTPEDAVAAYNELVNAPSKGQYIWIKFRGHKKGEPITPQKIGPAYFSGKPTIGGTSASKVPYDVAGRTPQIKVPDYEALAEAMRKYKTAVKKPPESAEPFTIEEIREHERLNVLNQLQKIFSQMGLATDFAEPEVILKGTITRGGYFLYPEGWQKKNYYQLKEVYEKYGHIPAYAAVGGKGHNEEELIGFGYDWEFVDPNDEYPDGYINAKIYLFNDVIDKYGLSKNDLVNVPVSISQWDDADHSQTDEQYITDLFHIAVSLDKSMRDRCSLGGGYPCRVSIIEDGIKNDIMYEGMDYEDIIEHLKEHKSEFIEILEDKLSLFDIPEELNPSGLNEVKVKDLVYELNEYLEEQDDVIPIYRVVVLPEKKRAEIENINVDVGKYWSFFPEGTNIYAGANLESFPEGHTRFMIVELVPKSSIDLKKTFEQFLEYPGEFEAKFKNDKRKSLARKVFIDIGKEKEFYKEEAEKMKENLKKNENKKKEKETEGKGKGRGWWGDPERHSRARKTGKADFSEKTKVKGHWVTDKYGKKYWVREHYRKKREKNEYEKYLKSTNPAVANYMVLNSEDPHELIAHLPYVDDPLLLEEIVVRYREEKSDMKMLVAQEAYKRLKSLLKTDKRAKEILKRLDPYLIENATLVWKKGQKVSNPYEDIWKKYRFDFSGLSRYFKKKLEAIKKMNKEKQDGGFVAAAKSIQRRGTEGKFTAWCKAHGYGGVTNECIQAALKAGGHAAQMAKFAKAARSVAKDKKKKDFGTGIQTQESVGSSIPAGKGTTSSQEASYQELKMERDKMPNEKKAGETKDDAIMDVPDAKSGEDATGFGETDAKGMFMKACKEAGKSPSECEAAWNALQAKGTGTGFEIPKEGQPDVRTYEDFAEIIDDYISEKLKPVMDFIETQKKLEIERREAEAEELKKKLVADGLCEDFVNALNYEQLKIAAKTHELTTKKIKEDLESKDQVSEAEYFSPVQDFDSVLEKKLEVLRKEKFGFT